FLRVGSNSAVEQGYNSDLPSQQFQFDEVGGGFTHSLALSSVPRINIGGQWYREFLLDLNESGSAPLLSLDELRFYVADSGTLGGNTPATGYDPTTHQLAGHSAVFDLDAGGDNWVKFDASLNSGSGSGDAYVYVPDQAFMGGQYLYLYCKFGVNAANDSGYEEWAVSKSVAGAPAPGSPTGQIVGS